MTSNHTPDLERSKNENSRPSHGASVPLQLPLVASAVHKDGIDEPRCCYRRPAGAPGPSSTRVLDEYDRSLALFQPPQEKTKEEEEAYIDTMYAWLEQLRNERGGGQGRQANASQARRHRSLQPRSPLEPFGTLEPLEPFGPLEPAAGAAQSRHLPSDGNLELCELGSGPLIAWSPLCSVEPALHGPPPAFGAHVEMPAATPPEGPRQKGPQRSQLTAPSKPGSFGPSMPCSTLSLDLATTSGNSEPQQARFCDQLPALRAPPHVSMSMTALVPQLPVAPRHNQPAPVSRSVTRAGSSGAAASSSHDLAAGDTHISVDEIAEVPRSSASRGTEPRRQFSSVHPVSPASPTSLVPQLPGAPRRYEPAPVRRQVTGPRLERNSATGSRSIATHGFEVVAAPLRSCESPYSFQPVTTLKGSTREGSGGGSTVITRGLAARSVTFGSDVPPAQLVHGVVDVDAVVLEDL